MNDDNQQRVANLIRDAVEYQTGSIGNEPVGYAVPRLLIENADPQRTVAALRDILAGSGELFDRGVPVRLVVSRDSKAVLAHNVTPDGLVMMAHQLTRPYALKTNKEGITTEYDARFPKPLTVMYLDWFGEWDLRPLNGIASAPLLRADGTICSAPGYDAATGVWIANAIDIAPYVPSNPTHAEAVAALQTIRRTFATFCFADATTTSGQGTAPCIDIMQPPGLDETAFLVGLLTAVCRPSLDFAPGVMLRAPQLSGAGAGKGLLVRLISRIAFGSEPHAVTGGSDPKELEKRLVSELISGGPVLFLDNLNNIAFKSDLLASAITERPARVRILGKSEMRPLNATAFIALTGNALTISEDLTRRFITIELDPGVEDPEARSFTTDVRKDVETRRAELLAAALTIWLWGRLQTDLPRGRSLGSFDQWSRWVRDPLLALGCRDPVERLIDAKQNDGKRQEIVAIFRAWHSRHGGTSVIASQLHSEVQLAIDPHRRGRQFVAAAVERLTGTRIDGFTLSRQPPPGKWGTTTYALKSDADRHQHRGHRGHETDKGESDGGEA
jgi:hypothetical protein